MTTDECIVCHEQGHKCIGSIHVEGQGPYCAEHADAWKDFLGSDK